MSLETPDRIRASAVLLFQAFDVQANATVGFASNNGFSSVGFIKSDDVTRGVVLGMDQPVNNQEGAVYTRGEVGVAIGAAYVTPNHFEIFQETEINDLAPFQVAIIFLGGSPAVFRIGVTTIKMSQVLPVIEGEPVAP